MYWFLAIEAAIVVVLICIGFTTSFDLKGDMNWKQWLQTVGGGLMLAAFLGRGNVLDWEFHRKMFFAGLLISLSTFVTWKRE